MWSEGYSTGQSKKEGTMKESLVKQIYKEGWIIV